MKRISVDPAVHATLRRMAAEQRRSLGRVIAHLVATAPSSLTAEERAQYRAIANRTKEGGTK